jgi:hypothetical protein
MDPVLGRAALVTAAVLAAATSLSACTPDPSSTAATSPGGPAPCGGPRLGIRAGRQVAGLGHVGLVVVFTNLDATPCTLQGYPGVVFDRGSAVPPDVTAHPAERGYLGGVAGGPVLGTGTVALPVVTLGAHGRASSLLEGTDAPARGAAAPCASFAAMLVTAPGATTAVRVAATLPACTTPEVHPVVPGTTGELLER